MTNFPNSTKISGPVLLRHGASDRQHFERIFADTPFSASRSKIKHMHYGTGPRGQKMPVGRVPENF